MRHTENKVKLDYPLGDDIPVGASPFVPPIIFSQSGGGGIAFLCGVETEGMARGERNGASFILNADSNARRGGPA